MTKKTSLILIITLIILTSCMFFSTSGLGDTGENKEFWALLVAPPDSSDPDRFYSQAEYLKDVLLTYGWKEDHRTFAIY